MDRRMVELIDTIVVHHSAGPLTQRLEDIRRIHVEQNGWEAIGYHYVIEADGAVRFGRRLDEIGAHVRGKNAHTIGICVIGDNTQLSRQWTPAQLVALKALIASLVQVLGPLKVLRHRDLAATLCPGLDDEAWLPIYTELIGP